jgi:hypothetical protein
VRERVRIAVRVDLAAHVIDDDDRDGRVANVVIERGTDTSGAERGNEHRWPPMASGAHPCGVRVD